MRDCLSHKSRARSPHSQHTCTAYLLLIYSLAGVPVKDLLRVPQSHETDYLPPRLECHEASNKSVSPLFSFSVTSFVLDIW